MKSFVQYIGWISAIVAFTGTIFAGGRQFERLNRKIDAVIETRDRAGEQVDSMLVILGSVEKRVNNLLTNDAEIIGRLNALRESYIRYLKTTPLDRDSFLELMEGIEFNLKFVKSADTIRPVIKIRKK